jgi:RNA polymerase sigma-70 factor (ECF subfamily)
MTEVNTFEAQRPYLFSIAYRMLGSASEAEDVVQDAWLRYQGADRSEIRSERAFLSMIVTRLALDRLKSARATREQYIGPWLPEPVLTEPERTPEDLIRRRESITLAFLVLLETLSPEERAVYLLREVFDYSHEEIAGVLNTSAANSRQLFHRAKARVEEGRPRFSASPERTREVVGRFIAAMNSGDTAGFEHVLAQDVRFWSDGGGKASAARRPLNGRAEVGNFFAGIRRIGQTLRQERQIGLELAEINSETAMVVRIDGAVDGVYVFTVEGDEIAAIRVMRNPDKLVYLEKQLRG